ncbi:MAG: glycosyltransferase family 4 protein [Anaerolineae bacterium]
MLIGVDASRATLAQRTGTETYSLHLIRALLTLQGNLHPFRLYFNRPPQADLFPAESKWEPRVIPLPRLWTHLRLSWEMLRSAPDVMFVPSHVVPLIHPPASVVTVHDLGYLRHPWAHPTLSRLYLDISTRYSAGVAARVVADSEATRADLLMRYGVAPEKVSVVYPGGGESRDPSPEDEIERVRAKYRMPRRYILHLGTVQPRKNLARLVEAYAILLKTSGTDCHLILAGRSGWGIETLLRRIQSRGLTDRIHLLGYVPSADLGPLLSGAQLLVLPSLYEGFGFPLVEAMAAGVPSVASDVSALSEVAGDAAILVDPLDIDAWAEAMGRGLEDEPLRAELIERGLERAKRFSWETSAHGVLAVLEAAAEG